MILLYCYRSECKSSKISSWYLQHSPCDIQFQIIQILSKKFGMCVHSRTLAHSLFCFAFYNQMTVVMKPHKDTKFRLRIPVKAFLNKYTKILQLTYDLYYVLNFVHSRTVAEKLNYSYLRITLFVSWSLVDRLLIAKLRYYILTILLWLPGYGVSVENVHSSTEKKT